MVSSESSLYVRINAPVDRIDTSDYTSDNSNTRHMIKIQTAEGVYHDWKKLQLYMYSYEAGFNMSLGNCWDSGQHSDFIVDIKDILRELGYTKDEVDISVGMRPVPDYYSQYGVTEHEFLCQLKGDYLYCSPVVYDDDHTYCDAEANLFITVKPRTIPVTVTITALE